jgi:hypothetical protein
MTFGFGRERASSRLGRDQYVTTMNLAANLKNKITGNGRPAATVDYYPFSKRLETALFLKTLPSRKEKKTFCFHRLSTSIGALTIKRKRVGSRPSNGRGAGIIDRLAETFIIGES